MEASGLRLKRAFSPEPGGVFGLGVVLAGILVALDVPFWPGGAAPRGVAIFVPVFPSAPCKPNQGERFSSVTKGRSTPSSHLDWKKAKVEMDARKVLYGLEGLWGA